MNKPGAGHSYLLLHGVDELDLQCQGFGHTENEHGVGPGKYEHGRGDERWNGCWLGQCRLGPGKYGHGRGDEHWNGHWLGLRCLGHEKYEHFPETENEWSDHC